MSTAVVAAQSARPDAPGSGALAAAAGPKGKGSGGAMQGRPLRCQHGRRWSQSARARWCCISWRSGGRLAVPGPKSDRAAPSWRGWVAQKSAAHHAMVPMQLHKHCHSRDLAERWRLTYCIILWPLYSLRNGKRPVPDQKRLGRPRPPCPKRNSEKRRERECPAGSAVHVARPVSSRWK